MPALPERGRQDLPVRHGGPVPVLPLLVAGGDGMIGGGGVLPPTRFGRLLCRLGLHHDGTDAAGWFSKICLRCGKVINP
jgi:hypothetical protein